MYGGVGWERRLDTIYARRRDDNYDDDDDDETTRRAALHTASPQYNTSIVCRQLRANRYTHAPHTYTYAHAHARPAAADAARSWARGPTCLRRHRPSPRSPWRLRPRRHQMDTPRRVVSTRQAWKLYTRRKPRKSVFLLFSPRVPAPAAAAAFHAVVAKTLESAPLAPPHTRNNNDNNDNDMLLPTL